MGGLGLYKTSLITPPFIEVPVASQESERSSICLLEYQCYLFLRFVCILEMFRQSGIFCFQFIWRIFWF